MSNATYIVGDVRDTLAAMPDGSVDLILTSPPFLALRSYLPADHPDKHREIGSEQGPAEFLDTLLALSAEWRRVLAPHGSMAVELGDTYAGGSAEGTDTRSPDSSRFRGWADGDLIGKSGTGWPQAKSLALIPELYRIGLAYGINPLTGGTSPAGRWKVRNVVRWCRPNPPVGALGDKFRPGTTDMVIACTSGKRWFDLDAVRTVNPEGQGVGKPAGVRSGEESATHPENGGNHRFPVATSNPAGAPPLDWWQVSTEPYAGSHYATWPRKLLTRPILAMCPRKVCTVCGEPSRRIVSEATYVDRRGIESPPPTINRGGGHDKGESNVSWSQVRTVETLGWTDCGHDSWRNGIVLDPFAGSGTTLAVATGHGRDAIGIDLDARNVALARDRVGPMFFTDTTVDEYRETHHETRTEAHRSADPLLAQGTEGAA